MREIMEVLHQPSNRIYRHILHRAADLQDMGDLRKKHVFLCNKVTQSPHCTDVSVIIHGGILF